MTIPTLYIYWHLPVCIYQFLTQTNADSLMLHNEQGPFNFRNTSQPTGHVISRFLHRYLGTGVTDT
jgi:hypothetical protein